MVAVSATWLVYEPGFEPLIVLLMAIAALVTETFTLLKQKRVRSPLSWVLGPYLRRKERLDLDKIKAQPIAKTSFDSMSGAHAIHHEVAGWHVWDDVSPTGELELRHKIGEGSWSTFNIITGHNLELWPLDIDNDGCLELIVRFGCGAHSRGLLIYRSDQWGKLSLVPGGEIGSDWPEIEISDQGSDGTYEVLVKQRDWNSDTSMGPLFETYRFHHGKVQRMT